MTQYTSLNNTDKAFHLTEMPKTINRSGIYPSGEAHFFDVAQNLIDIPPLPSSSIFEFIALDSPFSNATESYIIDDFLVFNPYIHNSGPSTGGLGYEVITSGLLNIAVERYNIYNISFRTLT
jgi:hypothetical protein